MINLENFMLNIEYPVPMRREKADLAAGEPRTMVKFKDVCHKKRTTSEKKEREWRILCRTDARYCIKPRVTMCDRSNTPLDFIYERKTDRYALEKYKTTDDLVQKV